MWHNLLSTRLKKIQEPSLLVLISEACLQMCLCSHIREDISLKLEKAIWQAPPRLKQTHLWGKHCDTDYAVTCITRDPQMECQFENQLLHLPISFLLIHPCSIRWWSQCFSSSYPSLMEFWASLFGPASLSCCGHMGSEANRWNILFLSSLSLLVCLSNK